MGRTIAIGDIHGELAHLTALLGVLPPLDAGDTLVFLGDYVDRGPDSAKVVELLMGLPATTPAKVVFLRGNHEDAWLRVHREGWAGFLLPPHNGCLAALRSFTGGPPPKKGQAASLEELKAMERAGFFPQKVIAWMQHLRLWHDDEHAIYVHAGLPWKGGRWLHPREVTDRSVCMWERTEEFYRTYQGKRVVFGHTITRQLPQELSEFTPEDPADAYIRDPLFGIDTGAGRGGFITAIELPTLQVYESRR